MPLSARAVSVSTLLPHPPQRVWQALTEPAELSTWFLLTTDFAPIRGHRFTLERRPDAPSAAGSVITGEILRVRLGQVLSFSIDDPRGPALEHAIVTWTLHPAGSGTAVRATHGPADRDALVPQDARDAIAYGWGVYLTERLPAHLLSATSEGH